MADPVRMVAAWNACAGIPTAALGAGVVAALVQACRAWESYEIERTSSAPDVGYRAVLHGQAVELTTAALAQAGNPATIEPTAFGDGTVVSSDEPLGDCPKEKRP